MTHDYRSHGLRIVLVRPWNSSRKAFGDDDAKAVNVAGHAEVERFQQNLRRCPSSEAHL